MGVLTKVVYQIRYVYSRVLQFTCKTIMRKLVIVFLFFIILPIAFSSFFSYSILQSVVRDKINASSEMAITKAAIDFDGYLNESISATNLLITDQDISQILSKAGTAGSASSYENINMINKKIFQLQSFSTDINLSNMTALIGGDGSMYSNLPQLESSVGDTFRSIIKEEELDLNDIYMKWGKRVYKIEISDFNSGYNKEYIVMIRNYIDLVTLHNYGVVIDAIPVSKFNLILKSLSATDGVKSYLINENGYILSSSDSEYLGKNFEFFDQIKQNSSKKVNTLELKDNGYILNYKMLKINDWQIIQVIPSDSLFSEIIQMRGIMILINLGFIFLFIGISYIFAGTISKPLKNLDKATQEIAAGNLDAKVYVNSRDEIANLASKFNLMTDNIKQLIQKNSETERKKTQMEIQMLYAQINPHFLFNTLNSIRWIAEASKIYNVSKAIVALTNLLKNTIIQKDEFITVHEEIDNVKNYILIQKFRYLSIIDEKYEIAEDIENNKMLKFILQPIVENSIIHGFNGIKYKGLITITGTEIEKMIKLTVSDNGVGMTEDQIQCILSNREEKKSGRFNGIGIANVNDRLKLNYGSEYGLKIRSTPGEGTAVDVYIPLLDGDDAIV